MGDAGPGPSYIEAGGEHHAYTQRTTRWMAHNAVHLARILKANPIPAEGNTFDDETEHCHHAQRLTGTGTHGTRTMAVDVRA